MTVLLEISDLHLDYAGAGLPAQVLRGINLTAAAGEVVGIVGESGCGKSTLALAMMGLLPRNAVVKSGSVRVAGQEILTAPPAAQRGLRGRGIAMIFQDPMTAFNPVVTLGQQLVDFQQSLGLSRAERQARAAQMLDREIGRAHV